MALLGASGGIKFAGDTREQVLLGAAGVITLAGATKA